MFGRLKTGFICLERFKNVLNILPLDLAHLPQRLRNHVHLVINDKVRHIIADSYLLAHELSIEYKKVLMLVTA